MKPAPALSVIVVAWNSEATIRSCLSALARQTDPDFELIVVDSSTDGTCGIVESEAPQARLLHFATRLYPGAARNRGVAVARGDIIAFVDSDCIAEQTWIARLKEAHSTSDAAAIGGSVIPANPESVVGWGAYLCEFSAWVPAGTARLIRDIPTCNISYKRVALERYGPFRESGYCSDTALNWKLSENGQAPLFLPDLQVAHFNVARIRRFLAKQVMHGRAFAQMRSEERALSGWRRLALAIGCLLLPAVLLARIARRIVPAGLTRHALGALPVVLLGLTAWSWGEARGYASSS